MRNVIKIVVLITILFAPAIKVEAAFLYPNNDLNYPYRSSPQGQVDQWNTFTRNCTSYAMWKINQAGLSFNNNPTGPNGSSTTMGNASTWDERAASIGYTVNNTPSVGNPVNWEANSGGAGGAGHVAWVEQVHANNLVFISEWNWNWGDQKYNERNNTYGDHYIKLINSGSTSCSTITNTVVNSGQSLNCSGNEIKVHPESFFYSGSTINLLAN